MGTSILVTIGSILAGGAVAAVTVVSLVSAQTSAPATSPTDINESVAIDYGSN